MKLTHDDIINQIIERPTLVELAGTMYRIEPPSMGKTFLLSRLIAELKISSRGLVNNLHKEIINVCRKQKNIVTRVISYYLRNTKDELFDEAEIKAETKRLEAMDLGVLACIMEVILSAPKMADFAKELGIEKEQERIRDIEAMKDTDKGAATAGGVSSYGSIIDAACERYGWTYDYVVWGISYTNLQLMLSDSPRTIYLSEEERKRVGALIDKDRVCGDTKAGMDRLKELLKQ